MWAVAAFGCGAAFALPPSAMVGVAAGVVVVASAFRGSGAALALVALTVPVQSAFAIEVGPASLTWTKALLAALGIGFAARWAVRQNPVRIDGVAWAFFAVVGSLVLSVRNVQDVGAWAGETYRWSAAALVYVVAANMIRTRRDVGWVVAAFGVSSIAVALQASRQLLDHAGPPSYTVNGVTRAFGSFGAPNPFAGYLEMLFLPLAGIALASLPRVRMVRPGPLRAYSAPILCLLGAGAGAAALGATQSRGGLLGAGAGLMVAAALAGPWVRHRAALILVVATIAILATGAGSRLTDRFSSASLVSFGGTQVTSANFAANERRAHWGAAVRMAEAHPLTGVGAGNFSARFREFTPVWRFRISRGHAHSDVLQILAQSGLAGLAAYLALFAAVVRAMAGRLRRAADPVARGLAIGGLAVTAAVVTHGMFEYLHVLSLGIQLSLVWALACGAHAPIQGKRSHADAE